MSDIQRYIHRPKGMDPDGCGKWCVHAEARNHYHKIIEDKDQEIEKLQKDIQTMVKKAADKNLDGYRELGAMCAEKDGIIDSQTIQIKRLREKLELLYIQASYAIGDLGHAMRTAMPEHKLAISQELEKKHDSIIKKTTKGEF